MMTVTAIGVAIVVGAMTTTTRATGTIETTIIGTTTITHTGTTIGAIGTKRLMVAVGAMVWVAPASSSMQSSRTSQRL